MPVSNQESRCGWYHRGAMGSPPASTRSPGGSLVLRGVPVPPQALITGDLACSRCSYNLRGNHVGGRCPECGHGVTQTITDRIQPALADEALFSFGRWYLALLLAYFAGCFFLLVAVFFAFGSAAARSLDLNKIRRIAGDSGQAAGRLHLAMSMTALETACAGGATLLAVGGLYGVIDIDLVSFAGVGAGLVVACSLITSAYLLLGLAKPYDLKRIPWECWGAIGCAALTVPVVLLGSLTLTPVGVAMSFLPLAPAVWLIWLASEHLAQVAAFQAEVPEDLIESMNSALDRQTAAEVEEFEPIPLAEPEEEGE